MDGKDLLRRVRQLLNEDSDTGWLDRFSTYDYLYEAAKDIVDRTGCIRSSQSITTVANDDEYDLNPDFLRLYAKDHDNRFFITLTDSSSNVHVLFWKDYEDILYDNNTASVTIPSNFSIIDVSDQDRVSGSANASSTCAADGETTLSSTSLFTDVNPGAMVHNITDGSDGVVLAKSSSTNALTTALFNSTGVAEWASSDAFVIQPQSRYQLYIDPPPSTAGYTITVPYIQQPNPVYSYYGVYRIPDQYTEALVKYAVFLYKYRDKEPDFGDALYMHYERAIGRSAYSINRAQRPGNFKVNFKKRQ